jgi:hypothetical protein
VSAAAIPATRAQTVIQRAYVYIVALVAVHMIVLGVANILRVFAEMLLGAPSGGFTGLPFVFAEFTRPRDQYREQASLAIALLAVGTPAWWIHFGIAQRAARAVEERASALRSLYVHTVVFVTALLVFGYGQRALRLVLQGTTFGSGDGPQAFFGLETEWQARAAGAAAMALTSAIALAFHMRLSLADRRAAPIAGRAADVRHLALYGLVLVGILFASSSTASTLDGLLRRGADGIVPLSGQSGTRVIQPPGEAVEPDPRRAPAPTVPPGVPPPGVPPKPELPSQDEFLRFQLLGAIPAILASIALWLATWIPLTRGLARGPDVEVERRSIIRKIEIYLVVIVSAVTVLIAATFALSSVGRRLLGDPVIETFTSMWHELVTPGPLVLVFGTVWLFHRRVVETEAARESEVARAAALRRLYTYLISAIGLGMAAIGAAGAIGVFGSQLMGMNTHSNEETARYVAFVLVGGAAWAFHWRTARTRLDDDERRSLSRRGYLYLSILGGVLGLLVFGSAALYQILTGVLAFSFTLGTWHDIWHFLVDSAVAGLVAWWSFRMLRADRAVLGTATEEIYSVTVNVRARDRDTARARVVQLLGRESDVSLKG